jgi:hypothetical protein
MTNQSFLISNYVNHAYIESQIERSNNFNSHLCVVKFDLKFVPEDGKKFINIVSFIYSFLDYTPVIYEGGNSFLVFIHESKIHTVVNTIKNMIMSIKIKFALQMNGIGITKYEDNEDKNDLIERVHRFYMKAKVSQNTDIYYGTKYFEYSHLGDFKNIQEILNQENHMLLYGFYKEVPLMNKVDIVDFSNGILTAKTIAEYLPVLKHQEYVYVEHSMIPDIIRAEIDSIDSNLQEIKLVNLKFIDDSPVHRKSIRVTPHEPIKTVLEYENELQIDGLLTDVSSNSLLFTTQLIKIEEIQAKGLQTKTFQVKFNIVDSEQNMQIVEVKAMIYKITGNQIVLNIYPTPNVKTIIAEYISMCQDLLLLELKKL